MNRRSFLRSILAAGVAPYVSTMAGVLMPVRPLWTPPLLLRGELGTVGGFHFIVIDIHNTVRVGSMAMGSIEYKFKSIDPESSDGTITISSGNLPFLQLGDLVKIEDLTLPVRR